MLWTRASLAPSGVLDRLRHPQPPGRVEGDVDRLLDVRLRSDELDLKTGRQVKGLALLFRRQWLRGGDVGRVGVIPVRLLSRARIGEEGHGQGGSDEDGEAHAAAPFGG
jgi:hypothetical protein